MRLIPAQFVKPYRKSNKNDFIDAEAIAEAVTKQNMPFAQEQLDWQAMHRVRDRLVQRRTALINEIRGFLPQRNLGFLQWQIHIAGALRMLDTRERINPLCFQLVPTPRQSVRFRFIT